jgi:hypothetical protein
MKQIIILLCLFFLSACAGINRWAVESYNREIQEKKTEKSEVHIEKVGFVYEVRIKRNAD